VSVNEITASPRVTRVSYLETRKKAVLLRGRDTRIGVTR
jgi:hypothetical protein